MSVLLIIMTSIEDSINEVYKKALAGESWNRPVELGSVFKLLCPE
jgi:hypothetical protein